MELRHGQMIDLNLVASTTKLNIDQLRRGIERLKFKGYVHVKESTKTIITLGSNGLDAITKKLPERRLVDALKSGFQDLNSIKKSKVMEGRELEAAMNKAKIQNGWIQDKTTESGERFYFVNDSALESSQEEKLIARIGKYQGIQVSDLSEEELKALSLLKKRPNFVNEKYLRDIELEVTPFGLQALKNLNISNGLSDRPNIFPIDVVSPVSTSYPGRTHPLTDLIQEIKETFVSLGFMEIEGETIQSTFWNFDALFIPQDHPAREMQDTFYMKGIKKEGIASNQLIRNVSQAHRKWWNYDWDLIKSEQLVLRTHTTPVTLKYLAYNGVESARIFLNWQSF
jgi:phenylalanyl-tRNA synthetase alpha chain